MGNVERQLQGVAGCKRYRELVRNVERKLLGLSDCKWYSVVVRNVERLLLGLTGCKWYSVVVRNVEGPLLDLTGCPCCGKRVKRVVFSVVCLVSKLRYLTMDCDVELCFSGKKIYNKIKLYDRQSEVTIVL